ncbi:type II toxin-antitoxin system PemK/MazF family toxin [Actinomycetospora sp. OC33-EN08]|uniref:Type II toxin-antitoxin system PemK/MazF family toxin n=1 Tax=Actinomycetospora aurantiaca TaxID=3129233 RepID=A0ABU8MN99_9PSEU
MRRGDLIAYEPVLATRPGVSRLRLIVSSDAVNDADLAVVLGLPVTPSDRGGLFSVRIGDHGWVSALSLEAVLRSRLGEVVGHAADDELQEVGIALRAAQDL